MNGFGSFIASPWGSVLAIAAMTLVTFLCRIAGVAVMSRVRITHRIERGLRALPGSIMMATVAPIAVASGPSGIFGLSAALTAMTLTRIEVAGVLAGLGTVAAARAFGL